MNSRKPHSITRRGFLSWIPKGLLLLTAARWPGRLKGAALLNDIFWIKGIPDEPFYLGPTVNYHAGVDNLLTLMGQQGLKFYRSSTISTTSGPGGLISANDVVLIKVNAQWKYRGCTNRDVIRGLIQRILDHPNNFTGEVVIFENGQGRGSLNCDTSLKYTNAEVHANANNEKHSFIYLEDVIFDDPRVSTFLLDPLRYAFIGETDHVTNGYRRYENVSYPCFTTKGGRRVELKKGIWNGTSYSQNLKLINVPVLKHHDTGGSEITAAVKHMYGILSMYDGQADYRHYEGLGDTCGRMIVSVCPPVLNIMDAIWVSHAALAGYPASATFRSNQLLASQDPVALDYWAAKYVLYPIDKNSRHHPTFSGIDNWLVASRDIINARGGIANPSKGIIVDLVTKSEAEMRIISRRTTLASTADLIGSWGGDGVYSRNSETGAWTQLASPAKSVAAADLDGDGLDDLLGIWSAQNEVWAKYSSTGAWKKIATGARCISAGDMNGDGRADFLGSWDDQGVFYQDSKTGLWVKIAEQASQIIAGDLDGDGQDDLIGIWPEQGGVWVKYSRSSEWEKIASTADWIAAGDMNGDGRTDFVGSWGDLGIFYRDSVSGNWFKIATPGTAIATGDLDGDGKDDLLGIWPGQGGVWVRYSDDGSWERLSSIPDALTTGRIRPTAKPLAQSPFLLATPPRGPLDSGISVLSEDRSSHGPGGWRFVWQEEKNLTPQPPERWSGTRIPGPGEPGFIWIDKQNLFPQQGADGKKLPKTTFDRQAGHRLSGR